MLLRLDPLEEGGGRCSHLHDRGASSHKRTPAAHALLCFTTMDAMHHQPAQAAAGHH